jgi:2-polyprenyl-6-methoxyphenol hydroxylase-like FAD-dependent oxidoreductase
MTAASSQYLANANRSTTPLKIGILGAGPAGLMSALSLEAYLPDAVDIVVLDRNASAMGYPGVEYGIQQRACRALERIGRLEASTKRANRCTEIAFSNSRLARRFPSIHPDPHYTRSVIRQEFLTDLGDLLRGSEIRRRHLVDTVSLDADGSVVVQGNVDERAFSSRFDLLIAADGVNSVVRRTLFPETAVVHDRGFSCIYMLIEDTVGVASEGFLARANSGRSELIMGEIATMTLFPMGRGRLAFGIGFDHAVRERLWREAGLVQGAEWADIPPETKFAIARRLTEDSRDDELVRALDMVPDWNSYKIYLWAMRDTDPLDKPYTDGGNVIAIGDAAHAIMPTIGMGASLAIEDAEALARRLRDAGLLSRARGLQLRESLRSSVFEPFAAERLPVWHDLVDRARRAAEGNFIAIADRKRFAIGPQLSGRVRSKVVIGAESLLNRLGV